MEYQRFFFSRNHNRGIDIEETYHDVSSLVLELSEDPMSASFMLNHNECSFFPNRANPT